MSARIIANKVIIVTGASSGIGRAVSLALAREHARLVLVARRQTLLESLAEEVRKDGGSALVLTLDLRERSHVEKMIAATQAEFGRIDVLINNAGFGYLG